MHEQKFEIEKVIAFWIKNAALKWDTAKSLKRSKKYADCLFFCHLVLESLLKAIVCRRTQKHAPYVHELDRLAEKAGVGMTPIQRRIIAEINSFNIRARYDDYKMRFYKKATKAYAEKYFFLTKEMKVWLEEKLNRNK